ncbi:MmgE/PrpD family protein [Bosea sp. (in: a-proteobacteria)]|uniref:MmgE/PrpD family protein n=1 Tax=Bosea sp. (in: a-proteobacteria) TaxID=1871050 RepID=UPI00260FEFD2|nr:MmgE/PrpD family protein [Bosea sp. (in: a-proteobacteria)]MCO5093499.1 MmgE/PrpD family protein [Bosea sp. (in: a-proteobacteria)]
MYPHADLIHYAAALPYDAIPPDVLAEARRMVLDTIGCIIAARATDCAPAIEAAAGFLSPGIAADSYLYARLADLMDFNEGYGGAHFGCGAVAVALALASTRRISGQDFMAAVVSGFETGARVMDAIGPYLAVIDGKKQFSRVWGIATPVVYAAVAAATRLMNLQGTTAVEAFSLAGANSPIPAGAKWSQAVALPNTKYCDAGWATLTGVMGALFAETGSTGLTDLLDDENGLLTMIGAANPSPAALSADLGQQWRLRAVIYKRWPCCGLLDDAMTLTHELLLRHDLDADSIAGVSVRADPSILVQRFANPKPRTQVSLQFSMPHNLAMLMARIPPGPMWQSAALAAEPRIARLRQIVSIEAHRPSAADPEGACSVEIRTAEGRSFGKRAVKREAPRANDADIIAKFRSLVAAPHADEIIRRIMAIDGAGALESLLAALRQAKSGGSHAGQS